LLPEESPFLQPPLIVRYFQVISATLLSENRPPKDINAYVVCLPSFSPEWALQLRRCSDGFILSMATAGRQLWSCADPGAVQVQRGETTIAEDLAAAIRHAWRDALAMVRHPSQALYGLDGENYHFALSDPDIGRMAGWTWSPDEGSPPGKLVKLAETLRQYVLAGDAGRISLFRQVKRDLVELG
jgi:hypothetical protein